MNNRKLSRRQFLNNIGKAGLGYGILSPLLGFKSITNPHLFKNRFEDYKVLVCLFMSGGNDSYNMLIPTGSEYNTYANTRSNLAISLSEILNINALNTGGRTFGLNPAMTQIQNLFNTGKLSFISNIGTLIQYVTAEEVRNESAPLPLGLFSHSDQQQEWMTGIPGERGIKGWAGKIADNISNQNPSNSIPMNVSLSGTNIFQSGSETVEFSIGFDPNSQGILGYGDNNWDGYNGALTSGIDSLLQVNYSDPYKKTYVQTIKNAKDAIETYKNALSETSEFVTEFSQNDLSRSFKAIAKMIKANEILDFKRQIFFIDFSGWDTHDELLNRQYDLLSDVSLGFGEFSSAMAEIGLEDNVTVFTMSDFGRTLTSNGNGTDHAWAGNTMVMGGAVNGQKIYGDYPQLDLENDLVLWDGVLVPTLPTDMYFAELCQWFGIENNLISQLFPTLGNFYNINSSSKPIGFLNY